MPLKSGSTGFVLAVLTVLWALGPAVAKRQNGPNESSHVGADSSIGRNKQSQDSAAGARAPEAVDPSQYAGTETCKSCHEYEAGSYDKSPHSKMPPGKHQGPEWQGCEACHGPGQEHAESGDPAKIIRFPALSREESSRRCLKCHGSSPRQANFLRSEHAQNNVGCLDCHSMHAPKVQAKLLKAQQPQLCYSCHKDVQPGASRSFHPEVKEGLANCSQCHKPHDVSQEHAEQAWRRGLSI